MLTSKPIQIPCEFPASTLGVAGHRWGHGSCDLAAEVKSGPPVWRMGTLPLKPKPKERLRVRSMGHWLKWKREWMCPGVLLTVITKELILCNCCNLGGGGGVTLLCARFAARRRRCSRDLLGSC